MVADPAVVALGDLARAGDRAADRELTRLAGEGSFHAQRELLTVLLGDPETGFERPFGEMARLELLARFVAFRGNALDVRRLAAILWQMARTAPDADIRADTALEAIMWLRLLADAGDGIASNELSLIAETFPDIWAIVEAGQRAEPVGERPPPPRIIITRTAPPPPIITPLAAPPPGESLGDILEQALAPFPKRTGWRGFIDRCRDWLSGLYWRLRLRLADILEGHA